MFIYKYFGKIFKLTLYWYWKYVDVKWDDEFKYNSKFRKAEDIFALVWVAHAIVNKVLEEERNITSAELEDILRELENQSTHTSKY